MRVNLLIELDKAKKNNYGAEIIRIYENITIMSILCDDDFWEQEGIYTRYFY